MNKVNDSKIAIYTKEPIKEFKKYDSKRYAKFLKRVAYALSENGAVGMTTPIFNKYNAAGSKGGFSELTKLKTSLKKLQIEVASEYQSSSDGSIVFLFTVQEIEKQKKAHKEFIEAKQKEVEEAIKQIRDFLIKQHLVVDTAKQNIKNELLSFKKDDLDIPVLNFGDKKAELFIYNTKTKKFTRDSNLPSGFKYEIIFDGRDYYFVRELDEGHTSSFLVDLDDPYICYFHDFDGEAFRLIPLNDYLGLNTTKNDE